MPPTFRLRVHTSKRDPTRFPEGDDALGLSLMKLVNQALERGTPRPAMLVFRGEQLEQFDLSPLLSIESNHRKRMLAAIAGQPGVECAAVLGILRIGAPGGPAQRAASVYLEWPDNRWWTSWQLLDPRDRTPRGDALVRRAVDGAPRPDGMGGWFARARRLGLQLHVRRQGGQPGEQLVH